MTTSENGLALIRSNEGFSAHVYDDNGKQAIGYGHDIQPGESFPQGINVNQASILLQQDLQERFEPTLNEWLLAHQIIPTQNQFDALMDFCYNLGPQSLLTMLGHGWDQVAQQIPRWNHSDGQVVAGLTARREKEVELFNS